MRNYLIKVINSVAFVLLVGVTLSCSNDSDIETPAQNAELLTRHFKLNVTPDVPVKTKADKNTRFDAQLNTFSSLTYKYHVNDTLYAFTQTGVFTYNKSILRCTKVDSETGSASFEGDISYSRNYKNVYFFKGKYDDNNEGYVSTTVDIDMPKYIEGDTISYLPLWGKSMLPDETTSSLDIQLNMVMSFMTLQWDKNYFKYKPNGYTLTMSCDQSDASEDGFVHGSVSLHLLDGTVSATRSNSDTYWNLEVKVGAQKYSKISFPLFPGTYKNLVVTIITSTSNGYSTKPMTFTTVIGSPSKVDDSSKNIYSCNRLFWIGTISLSQFQWWENIMSPDAGNNIYMGK